MTIFNLKSVFLSLLIFAPCGVIHTSSTIKDAQLGTYVTECLDYWFYPNNTYSQLSTLNYDINVAIHASSNYDYQWSWQSLSYEVVYPLDYVYQVVLGETLEFIYDASYYCALDFTNPGKAESIALHIYDHLVAFCAQPIQLARGAFSIYIGTDLRSMVWRLYQESIGHYA